MAADGTDPLTVGFVGGHGLAGNVRTLLANVRRLLAERPTTFDCHLVAASGVDPIEGYEVVDPGVVEADSATATIRTLRAAVTRYARERSPDVLFQVTRFPAHGVATALAGTLTGTPTVTRLAGDNFEEYRFESGLGATARTFALKNVLALAAVHLPERVVALGPTGRRRLRARGRRSGVVELPQPVDTDRFHPLDGDESAVREELGLPPAPTRLLLTVGRLSRRKGMEAVRATARALADRDADVEWIVVGTGPYRERLAELPNVRAPGRVPHDEIPSYYRAADLLVHPSLHEGLPNTLLEATACGLPSVARDVGDCASVATETFEDADRLPALALAEYEEPELPERFRPDQLARAYEELLVDVAAE